MDHWGSSGIGRVSGRVFTQPRRQGASGDSQPLSSAADGNLRRQADRHHQPAGALSGRLSLSPLAAHRGRAEGPAGAGSEGTGHQSPLSHFLWLLR